MRRLSYLVLHLVPFGMTVACLAWLLTQSPFTAPIVQRSAAQIESRLSAAMAREVDLAWLLPRLQEAILAQDLMQLGLLTDIATDHGIILPPALQEEITALQDAGSGFVARTAACGACAIDITSCRTLTQITACALPFELTPAGDVNAVRRAGVNYIAGEDVDRLDLGLALVGLGATGAILATGGGSYSIKAATSLLRLARRMGTLTVPLAARLTALIGDAVRWDRMGDLAALRIGPADMVNSAKLGELADIGGSLRRVADNTSLAETVSLLRHVDTAEDAARLARVSEAMGPRTRNAFSVLGKSRVMRATIRLSDLALGAALAIYAAAIQMLIFVGQQFGNVGLKATRRLIKPKPR